MKLPNVALFSALTLAAACSRESRSPAEPTAASTLPTQTALVSSTETGASAQPGAATIPTNAPSIPSPVAPPMTSADEKPLVPSSGVGAPRPSVDELPPGRSTQALDRNLDKADSESDRESLREIRALLSADKSLSTTARRVTVIAKDGRVRLSGQVNTAEERAAIERAARQAANVREVKNELVVLSAPAQP
ncbi:MAG: BON domain-containing protein [Myxococcales bacterium]|nr:MAG: BON domain-containing protein [Myxococcales bacterium]